jgi:hypothetical protein
MHMKRILLAGTLFAGFTPHASAQYPGWQHEGSMYILTTPEGADLPETATEQNFPLLLRLTKGAFDFSQAKPDGADLRISAGGRPLSYQIEDWDGAQGMASVWVKIPAIKGNTQQEIKLHWGKPDAASESNGAAVFNADNGYASVIHMTKTLKDELGTVTPVDDGTTVAAGFIGQGRHFAAGKGINCGDHIKSYPFSNNPLTSEVWFRAERAGAAVLGWGRYATRFNGNTNAGNEVVINIDSPAGLRWSSDGPGGATAITTPDVGRWYHVAATYAKGTSKIYVNGKLEASNTLGDGAMSLMNDIGMTIGGFRGTYQFAGDIDEVRVSRVERSADWIKLQYENQKAGQSLAGCLVQAGNAFAVTPREIKLEEGKSLTVTAQAGGARKLCWIVKRDGKETIVAVDQFRYNLDAGRVVGDTAYVLQLKAVFANEVKTIDIPVTIREDIPDPVLTLKAPANWDGRQTIEVVPLIANLKEMEAKGAGKLNHTWTVPDGAVIQEIAPRKLILKRSQYSGKLTVNLVLDNGGAQTTSSTTIQVAEPKNELWVRRIPASDEKPVKNQFYARDDTNEGTLHYNGTLTTPADAVFLKVYADGRLVHFKKRPLNPDKSYAFSAKLKPGLIHYSVELGSLTGTMETVLDTVPNLVCGDAYLVDGQSNAVADNPEDSYSNEWIRSFGNLCGGTGSGWGNAVRATNCGDAYRIGYWPMTLARSLMLNNHIPICIINGAVGGTRIDQHQANPADHFDKSAQFAIYGNLLERVAAARLTHGIRAVLWHQGENNSGAAAPTGDYDWKSYQQYFVEMAAAWKQDYPNIQHYYVFQVWPLPCGMGGDASSASDMLREQQRTLPRLFSNMSAMSTLGVSGFRGLCHFDSTGYTEIADLICPLVGRDHYGLVSKSPVTAPNLRRASFTTPQHDEITLEFDQNMAWNNEALVNLYLDRLPAKVASGSASGKMVQLKLADAAACKTIGYVVDQYWDGTSGNLLYGSNGVAALTFFNVPVEP